MPTSSSRPFAAGLALALAGCSGGHAGRDGDFRPVLAAPPAPAPANGAIFQASSGYAALTSGNKAAAVGDILTIVLVERTQAAKENSATLDRNGGIGLTPPATGILSAVKPTDLNMSGKQSFKGAGQATQSNSLTGEISVTVAQVYPNGTMLVRGQKLLTLPRGDVYIRLSGLVRPDDVGSDNRVPSTRVADARIA
jgi:flagellar L-ring protein precursor FlgH